MSNPARWKPISKPPIPLKNDANVGFISARTLLKIDANEESQEKRVENALCYLLSTRIGNRKATCEFGNARY